ncbi:response regulator transcription factor [Chengkuizengella axinellae]|uniref:Response regulator transcription factor n=1 Tax=Chengkuizengella axinellae TaxID=3064388 RepID=A0ABT9IX59_9BACL|nr:response regulator transcription factor [Chengkuizengella sp. 2205SS18-9]MDP5273937.1 response regulator transcription factor [Chengkuizengella sp. 2205SS18-9]
MKTILVVEDEIAISRVLTVYLRKAEYQVELAYDAIEAIEQFDKVSPALVLLDVMLPNGSGWEILKQIRNKSACPVIMLTALGQINDRLSGLEQGADDYIVKPFDPDEVIARIKAVLRRPNKLLETGEKVRFGSLVVDLEAHSVTLNNENIELNPRDLSLFLFFVKHPNQTFSREQLLDLVWGMDYDGSDRAVDLAVKRIRKSLKEWASSDGEIKTLRGLGYQFSVNE